jgi:hypothetical protein
MVPMDPAQQYIDLTSDEMVTVRATNSERDGDEMVFRFGTTVTHRTPAERCEDLTRTEIEDDAPDVQRTPF